MFEKEDKWLIIRKIIGFKFGCKLGYKLGYKKTVFVTLHFVTVRNSLVTNCFFSYFFVSWFCD